MNGMQQWMLEGTREFGRSGGRIMEAGGHHLGGLEIAWMVLGILLWAAVMTALVMGMITMVRHLRRPKGDVPKDEKSEDDKSAK